MAVPSTVCWVPQPATSSSSDSSWPSLPSFDPSYKKTNPNHPKIGVTHTPTIGLSHTPSTGVSQTDFEATGKYHLNNLNRPLKTTKTTVFTPLPPLHATHTRIHRHRAPVSTTFLHSCLPPSHTRINLALSPASTSHSHPYQPRAFTRHFPRSND